MSRKTKAPPVQVTDRQLCEEQWRRPGVAAADRPAGWGRDGPRARYLRVVR